MEPMCQGLLCSPLEGGAATPPLAEVTDVAARAKEEAAAVDVDVVVNQDQSLVSIAEAITH